MLVLRGFKERRVWSVVGTSGLLKMGDKWRDIFAGRTNQNNKVKAI
jgi:hypothetical protein